MSRVAFHPQVTWVQWWPSPPGLTASCTVCGAQQGSLTEHGVHAFAERHRAHQSASPRHYGAGDMVARATKALGLETCTPCEKRRRLLNQIAPRVWRR